MDWISNSQLEKMTKIDSTKCSTAKNQLIKMKILVQEGRKVGINKNISEWKLDIYQNGKSFTETVKKSFTETVKRVLPKQSNTKDNITKDSKYNNTTSKDVVGKFPIENNPSSTINKFQFRKSESVPYQAMIDAYHEILPEMSRVGVLRDSRKSKMRTFWQRCNREYLKNHNEPFTIENWKGYLNYIANHCRWMTEDRPDGKGGYWRAKNIDYLITDKCYVSVKEDRANDRS